MADIYLQHPVHGGKVASTDMEMQHDIAQGWVRYDPTPPEMPSIFAGNPDSIPEGFPAKEWLAKAGYETLTSIPRDKAELIKISGIGNATALTILDKLDE